MVGFAALIAFLQLATQPGVVTIDRDNVEIRASATIRVEHFELDGYAVLKLRIEPG